VRLDQNPLSQRRLSGAKKRMRRRARALGAVMFIVAMTLAVIAAMGVYALNVAATEVKTAGFVREETQVHYLSEFGILGAAQEVTGPKAQLYLSLMLGNPATNCTSLAGVPANAGSLPLACRVVGSTQMAAQWNPPITPLLQQWTANSPQSARGSVGLPTAPDFYVELTDPTRRMPPAGYDTNQGLCFMEFTAASVGLSQLTSGLGLASYLSEGLETSRGRIVGGPIRCN
jgi:hypothetical protein